jgi:hypothetical protein
MMSRGEFHLGGLFCEGYPPGMAKFLSAKILGVFGVRSPRQSSVSVVLSRQQQSTMADDRRWPDASLLNLSRRWGRTKGQPSAKWLLRWWMSGIVCPPATSGKTQPMTWPREHFGLHQTEPGQTLHHRHQNPLFVLRTFNFICKWKWGVEHKTQSVHDGVGEIWPLSVPWPWHRVTRTEMLCARWWSSHHNTS